MQCKIGNIRAAPLFVAGLLVVTSALGQNPPTHRSDTKSPALQEFILVGRVLASPDPLMNAGTLDCHIEEFLFGAESNGEQGKKVITPVEISFCYYGNEKPLSDAFFDHSKVYELHVYRTCGGDYKLKDVACETIVDSKTGIESPPVMGMQVLDGVPKHLLSNFDLLLPCYVLRWGGFRVLSQDSDHGPRTTSPALWTTPCPGLPNAAEQTPEPPCKSDLPLFKNADGKPYWLTTEQLLERANHCEAPTFPPLARTARIEGTAILSILVDQKGEVSCIKAVTGHPLLLGVAIEAARKWKFKPIVENGEPVGFYGWLAFHFSTSGPDPKRNPCLEAHW